MYELRKYNHADNYDRMKSRLMYRMEKKFKYDVNV
jgi:hypothetical protein